MSNGWIPICWKWLLGEPWRDGLHLLSIVEGAAPAWRIYEDEVAVRPFSTSDR
jgi:hypothetical protein